MTKRELPKLKYSYNSLEPYIDSQTMEIHHTKHHQAYLDKLNEAVEKNTSLQNMTVNELLQNLDQLPEEARPVIRNHGGGHYNHSLFWEIMKPNGSEISSELLKLIQMQFGSMEEFKVAFTQSALARFGSGWAWLVKNTDSSLEIISTPNQDNPISQNKEPVLGLDLWEHAYYLKYQNRRAEYVQNWWNLVNWDAVNSIYTAGFTVE